MIIVGQAVPQEREHWAPRVGSRVQWAGGGQGMVAEVRMPTGSSSTSGRGGVACWLRWSTASTLRATSSDATAVGGAFNGALYPIHIPLCKPPPLQY
jgi:hypothetical protein